MRQDWKSGAVAALGISAGCFLALVPLFIDGDATRKAAAFLFLGAVFKSRLEPVLRRRFFHRFLQVEE